MYPRNPNGRPPVDDIIDKCWVEEDYTAWYQIHGGKKKGPWRDIVQAYVEMEKAQKKRDAKMSIEEQLAALDRTLKRRRARHYKRRTDERKNSSE
jgi:hypothetical protein